MGARGPAAGWDLNAGAWFSYRAPLGALEQVCPDLQNLKMLPVQARRPLLAVKVGAGINNSILSIYGSTTGYSNRYNNPTQASQSLWNCDIPKF